MANAFTVYADGSSGAGGGKPIGWGYVVLHGDKVLTAGCGGFPKGTNGQAELMAAREGLRALIAHPTYLAAASDPFHTIELVSDSQVTLGLASGAYSPSKNIALATHLREMCVKYLVRTRWVKGHSGEPGNEMCDRLAAKGKAGATPYVVLVCGSRDMPRTHKELIRDTLLKLPRQPDLILEGGASGADTLAGEVADELGIPKQVFMAQWTGLGDNAGRVRNQEMLDQHPSLVVAFYPSTGITAGTRDMVRRANAKRTPTQLVEYPP